MRKGNWNAVRRLVNEDGNALMATIMTIGDREMNVLEVAIATAQDELVEDVIALMPHRLPIFVKALCFAARGGRMRIVEALLKGRPSVIPGINSVLFTAILTAPKQKEVIWVLARRSLKRPT
ncbi:hypothetical protein NL676_002914 [Syzygium grande]|nr:hypothetical protein NL676_002914 [Syzygium grande]